MVRGSLCPDLSSPFSKPRLPIHLSHAPSDSFYHSTSESMMISLSMLPQLINFLLRSIRISLSPPHLHFPLIPLYNPSLQSIRDHGFLTHPGFSSGIPSTQGPTLPNPEKSLYRLVLYPLPNHPLFPLPW
jgi:hypothetical protein